jgi:hypothetical protein
MSSLNPATVGQSVTFTATVSSSGGTPTGSVTFMDGSAVLGTVTLNNGQASISTASLPLGDNPITADYSGDTGFQPSTSAILHETVLQATQTTLSSAPNPSVFGQGVTLTAMVSAIPPGSQTPTGMVTFFMGAVSLGSVSLSGGVASLFTSALPVGADVLTAVYGGDSQSTGSTSAALTQQVNQAQTQTQLSVSPVLSTQGGLVTFTATVSAVAPGSGSPTGMVVFLDQLTFLGSATVDANGQAVFSTSSLSVGKHLITAVYAGDVDFIGSSSASVKVKVTKNNSGDAYKLVADGGKAEKSTTAQSAGGLAPTTYSHAQASSNGVTASIQAALFPFLRAELAESGLSPAIIDEFFMHHSDWLQAFPS